MFLFGVLFFVCFLVFFVFFSWVLETSGDLFFRVFLLMFFSIGYSMLLW